MDAPIAQVSDQVRPVVTYTMTLFTTYGLSVLGALAILVVGLWLAGRAGSLTQRLLTRSRFVETTLIHFFASAVKYLIVTLTVIAVLNKFGVETASLLTVLGAASLAIGLALQGTLSHIAAGIMLLIFRPFRTGDFIELEKISGTVKEVTLFFTVMITPENIYMTVPNGLIWGQWIRNHSIKDGI